MKKEIIDFKGRKLLLNDVNKIEHTFPDEGKAGKFIIKAILADKNIVIYQSVGTEDTWHYNKLEISYVMHTLIEYIELRAQNDTELDLRKTIEFCRTDLFKSYDRKVGELEDTIAKLEKKLQDVASKIVIPDAQEHTDEVVDAVQVEEEKPLAE